MGLRPSKDRKDALVTDLMTIPDVHVMVLDDQSPDGTGEIADAPVPRGRLAYVDQRGRAKGAGALELRRVP